MNIREHLRDAPLAIDVSALLVQTEERMKRAVVARVVTHAARELGGILVGDLLACPGRRAVVGLVHASTAMPLARRLVLRRADPRAAILSAARARRADLIAVAPYSVVTGALTPGVDATAADTESRRAV